MINLLTKIEQDYGLPVAISLAKQAIEQNGPLVRELKTYKNRIIERCIMSRLLAWSPTKEGHKYWSNISTVDSYYRTNMDFLKKDVRDYFFKQYPDVYSKVEDLPPAKYNFGANVRNSLVSSGCIVNGTVEDSVLFKKIYVGNNSVIKNSIILNNVYIGDNAYIENCIVESNSTIKANSRYVGENGTRIVVEDSPLYY